MARMHSRRKGISGSKKPAVPKLPAWFQYKPKEVEMLIQKLAKEGKSASEIGLFLRDSYGVPDVKLVMGKTVTAILQEKGVVREIPEDLFNLIKKAVAVRKHMGNNNQDMTALRGLQLTESKIKRLVKYYKRAEALPKNWKYDAESLRLYVG